ncbi:hypothetical protein BCR34DRAFT_366481 [Clohesyomyces aquaticus]|uniref:C2H2-type domain-containing protein n=1 Tax=Clohesyomyces aquaticus TaxID=1231657 RepID=A0A1Y1ZHA2_9PLEO|nr:hypothetical protein BCR34DRAFT_366481 [Clohesyomyces aquaticus]
MDDTDRTQRIKLRDDASTAYGVAGAGSWMRAQTSSSKSISADPSYGSLSRIVQSSSYSPSFPRSLLDSEPRRQAVRNSYSFQGHSNLPCHVPIPYSISLNHLPQSLGEPWSPFFLHESVRPQDSLEDKGGLFADSVTRSNLKRNNSELYQIPLESSVLATKRSASPDLSLEDFRSTFRAPEALACPHCGIKFHGKYGRTNLARHKHQKHKFPGSEKQPYCSCSICGNPFNRSDALLKHERKKHPQLERRPKERKNRLSSEQGGNGPASIAQMDDSATSDSRQTEIGLVYDMFSAPNSGAGDHTGQPSPSMIQVDHEEPDSEALTKDVIHLLATRGILASQSLRRQFLQWLEQLTADAKTRYFDYPVTSGFEGVLHTFRRILDDGDHCGITTHPSGGACPSGVTSVGSSNGLSVAGNSRQSQTSGSPSAPVHPRYDQGRHDPGFGGSDGNRVDLATAPTSLKDGRMFIRCPVYMIYCRHGNAFPDGWSLDHNVCMSFFGENLSDLGEHLARKHQLGFSHANRKGKKIRCECCWFFVLDKDEDSEFHGKDAQGQCICPKRVQPRRDVEFIRACCQLVYRRLWFTVETRFPKCFHGEDGDEGFKILASGQPSIRPYRPVTVDPSNTRFLGQRAAAAANSLYSGLNNETTRIQAESAKGSILDAIVDFLQRDELSIEEILRHASDQGIKPATDWIVSEAAKIFQEMTAKHAPQKSRQVPEIQRRTSKQALLPLSRPSLLRLGDHPSPPDPHRAPSLLSQEATEDSGYRTQSVQRSSNESIRQADITGTLATTSHPHFPYLNLPGPLDSQGHNSIVPQPSPHTVVTGSNISSQYNTESNVPNSGHVSRNALLCSQGRPQNQLVITPQPSTESPTFPHQEATTNMATQSGNHNLHDPTLSQESNIQSMRDFIISDTDDLFNTANGDSFPNLDLVVPSSNNFPSDGLLWDPTLLGMARRPDSSDTDFGSCTYGAVYPNDTSWNGDINVSSPQAPIGVPILNMTLNQEPMQKRKQEHGSQRRRGKQKRSSGSNGTELDTARRSKTGDEFRLGCARR